MTSYLKDADGNIIFPGQPAWAQCDTLRPRHQIKAHQLNCFSPTRRYIMHLEGEVEQSVYLCCQCAPLVIKNTPANVNVEPARTVEFSHEDWRLWDDGQIERKGKGGTYLAPVRGESVPGEITLYAEEADLELWGWRESDELRTSETTPFRNLLTFAYIWEREEDGHHYWRTKDGWVGAPTFVSGDPDWDNAVYLSDMILSDEERTALQQWLEEKP